MFCLPFFFFFGYFWIFPWLKSRHFIGLKWVKCVVQRRSEATMPPRPPWVAEDSLSGSELDPWRATVGRAEEGWDTYILTHIYLVSTIYTIHLAVSSIVLWLRLRLRLLCFSSGEGGGDTYGRGRGKKKRDPRHVDEGLEGKEAPNSYTHIPTYNSNRLVASKGMRPTRWVCTP